LHLKKKKKKAEDTGDVVTFMFESKNADRISDFELKLMDIDSEQLGIPDSEYGATVRRSRFFGFYRVQFFFFLRAREGKKSQNSPSLSLSPSLIPTSFQ